MDVIRGRYHAKIEAFRDELHDVVAIQKPEDTFCFRVNIGRDDVAFTRILYQDYGIKVLPGSYLSVATQEENPGAGYIRSAMTADLDNIVKAAKRIKIYLLSM